MNEFILISKNGYKETQCLKSEQMITGKTQLLLDKIPLFFVLFPCFLYKTYKCQEKMGLVYELRILLNILKSKLMI
jgi:hypothetical protein